MIKQPLCSSKRTCPHGALALSALFVISWTIILYSCGPGKPGSSIAPGDLDRSPELPLVLVSDLISEFNQQSQSSRTFRLLPLVMEQRGSTITWGFRRGPWMDQWVWPVRPESSLSFTLPDKISENRGKVIFSIRARREGNSGDSVTETTVSLFLNSAPIGVIHPDKNPRLFSLPLENEALRPGTNILTVKTESQDTRCLFSHVRLDCGESTVNIDEKYLLETFRDVTPLTFRDKKLHALCLSGNQTVTFNVTIPDEAWIYFSRAELFPENKRRAGTTAKITVHSEDQSPTVIFQFQTSKDKLTSESWHDEFVSLAPWAGKNVKLTFTHEGQLENTGGLFCWGHPLVLQSVPRGNAAGKPNLFLFLVDTLRRDRLGAYGYATARTPELDRFCRTATLYQDPTAQAPSTLTSVSSLFTGTYPCFFSAAGKNAAPIPHKTILKDKNRTGKFPVTQLLTEKQPGYSLVTDIGETIVQALQQKGYFTAGITTNPLISRKYGFHAGFDRFDDTLRFGNASDVFSRTRDLVVPRPGKPSFVYLHFMDPHFPYHPPEHYVKMAVSGFGPTDVPANPWEHERFYSALYDAEIMYTDRVIGMLFTEMKRMGTFETATVIITADHGEEFRERGNLFHNSSLHDEQISVPLLIKSKNDTERTTSRFVPHPVSLADLFPTLVSLAGVQTHRGLSGTNLMSESSGSQVIYSELKNFDLIEVGELKSIRNQHWKYITTPSGNQNWLYNLFNDPAEKKDLSDTHSDEVSRMKTLLDSDFLTPDTGSKHTWDRETVYEDLKALGYIE